MNVNYMASQHASQYFHKHASSLGLALDCEIVDVAAGTGRVGQEVNISAAFSIIFRNSLTFDHIDLIL